MLIDFGRKIPCRFRDTMNGNIPSRNFDQSFSWMPYPAKSLIRSLNAPLLCDYIQT